MQEKNKQLGALLDTNMFNRAETYKNDIIERLSRPRDRFLYHDSASEVNAQKIAKNVYDDISRIKSCSVSPVRTGTPDIIDTSATYHQPRIINEAHREPYSRSISPMGNSHHQAQPAQIHQPSSYYNNQNHQPSFTKSVASTSENVQGSYQQTV